MHTRTFGGENAGATQPDAFRSTRNQNLLAAKFQIHDFSLSFVIGDAWYYRSGQEESEWLHKAE
jgi:hypothetical protein